MSILIIGAIGTIVATSLLMISVGSAQISLISKDSAQARYMADTCAESALMAIRNDTEASGSTSLVFPEGDCSFNIIMGQDENRTIQATGMTNGNVRKINIAIDKINPKINIVSWKEVADF